LVAPITPYDVLMNFFIVIKVLVNLELRENSMSCKGTKFVTICKYFYNFYDKRKTNKNGSSHLTTQGTQ